MECEFQAGLANPVIGRTRVWYAHSLTLGGPEWIFRCKAANTRFSFFCTSSHCLFHFREHDTYTPRCSRNLTLSIEVLDKLFVKSGSFLFKVILNMWHFVGENQGLEELKVILTSMVIVRCFDFSVDDNVVSKQINGWWYCVNRSFM